MALNPNIISSIRPPEMPDFRQVAMFKQQQAQNALLRQKTADELHSKNLTRLATSQGYNPDTGEIDIKTASQFLIDNNMGDAVPALQEQLYKTKGEKLGVDGKALKLASDHLEYARNLLSSVPTDNPTAYAQAAQEIIKGNPELAAVLPSPENWNDKTKKELIASAKDKLKELSPRLRFYTNPATGRSSIIDMDAGVAYPIHNATLKTPAAAPAAAAPAAAPVANAMAQPVPETPAPTNLLGAQMTAPSAPAVVTPTAVSNAAPVANTAPPAPAFAAQVVPKNAPAIMEDMANTGRITPEAMQILQRTMDPYSFGVVQNYIKTHNIQVDQGNMPTAAATQPSVAQDNIPTVRGGMGGPEDRYNISNEVFEGGVRPYQGRETVGEHIAKQVGAEAGKRELPLSTKDQLIRHDKIATERGVIVKRIGNLAAGINKVRDALRLSPEQKEAVSGFSGRVPSVWPGSKDADNAIDTVKGALTQLGKEEAGAIGPMAVQEWEIVRNMITAFDPAKMTPQKVDDKLREIEGRLKNLYAQIANNYKVQYGDDIAKDPHLALPALKERPRKPNPAGARTYDPNNPLLKGF